ncbi:hypothetical protein M758_N028200 [Ceratodon purpureus]|nr:hypothetical protein M758_N028200 [Ceratodon purpureus]
MQICDSVPHNLGSCYPHYKQLFFGIDPKSKPYGTALQNRTFPLRSGHQSVHKPCIFFTYRPHSAGNSTFIYCEYIFLLQLRRGIPPPSILSEVRRGLKQVTSILVTHRCTLILKI